jgi:hypothetical protein
MVVVERDVLDQCLPLVWSNAVDEGNDAFVPLVDLNVFGMRSDLIAALAAILATSTAFASVSA